MPHEPLYGEMVLPDDPEYDVEPTFAIKNQK